MPNFLWRGAGFIFSDNIRNCDMINHYKNTNVNEIVERRMEDKEIMKLVNRYIFHGEGSGLPRERLGYKLDTWKVPKKKTWTYFHVLQLTCLRNEQFWPVVWRYDYMVTWSQLPALYIYFQGTWKLRRIFGSCHCTDKSLVHRGCGRSVSYTGWQMLASVIPQRLNRTQQAVTEGFSRIS